MDKDNLIAYDFVDCEKCNGEKSLLNLENMFLRRKLTEINAENERKKPKFQVRDILKGDK
jgi:hypothetical protein